MLGLAMGAKTGGIGSEKGEGRFRILGIFSKVEVDPADEVPPRVHGGEVPLKTFSGGGHVGLHDRRHEIPEGLEDLRGQIFPARHRRTVGTEALEDFPFGEGNLEGLLLENGCQGGDVSAGKVAPKGQNRRKRRRGLPGPQGDKTDSLSPGKGLGQPRRKKVRNRRRIGRLLEHQMSPGSQSEGCVHKTFPGKKGLMHGTPTPVISPTGS